MKFGICHFYKTFTIHQESSGQFSITLLRYASFCKVLLVAPLSQTLLAFLPNAQLKSSHQVSHSHSPALTFPIYMWPSAIPSYGWQQTGSFKQLIYMSSARFTLCSTTGQWIFQAIFCLMTFLTIDFFIKQFNSCLGFRGPYDTSKYLSSSYHPQNNGQMEWTNQSIEQFLHNQQSRLNSQQASITSLVLLSFKMEPGFIDPLQVLPISLLQPLVLQISRQTLLCFIII